MSTIRPASPGDEAGLARVQAAAWEHAYPGLMPQPVIDHFSQAFRTQRWREILGQSEGPARTLLYEDDEGIQGFVSIGPDRGAKQAGRGEIWALYVHPDRWRAGIGRALMAASEPLLWDIGPGPHCLWVLKGNDRAIAFYESFGYALTPEEKEGALEGTLDGAKWSELRMVREIASP